jgi:predicted ATPase
LRQSTIDELVDAELERGEHRRLASGLEALVAEQPLRERRWGQLMRALYGSGQQAEALRAYQRAREVLVEQMGVEPGPELRRLEAAVLAQDDTALGAPTSAVIADRRSVGARFRRRGNVRHPIGSLVGRKDELVRLVALVDRHRLVTLTGPGGVGKTRLAVELAVRLLPDVDDGVWWVDLAAARDGTDVLAALHRALQMDPGGPTTLDGGMADVVAAFGDGSAIVVLDNCEQLLGTIEPVIEELLGRCGGVHVVATSRAALSVPGEITVAVAPLDIESAMTLFEQRIEGLDQDASASSATIAAICERVDRLPLALELAAARARHFSLEEIAARLADRFELLGDRAQAPDHQRDLRAVAGWSYALLDDHERMVFERLSVFAAGATLDAARRVCADDDIRPDDVERALTRLVDKSLVQLDRTGPSTRYRMLQTLSQYASEHLAERGDHRTRLAHAQWVRDLAAAAEFGAPTTGATIATIQNEDVAVRNAITWAIESDPRLAVDICTKLSPFWFGTMRVSTGWELLTGALDAAGDRDRELRAAALAWATVFSTMLQEVDAADRMAEEAWALELELDDPERLGRLRFTRARAA